MKKPVHRLAALVCAGLTAPLLAGCGTGVGEGAPGVHVVMGTADEVTSLDPAAGYDPGSWLLFTNVFQSLLSFPKGGYVPEPEAAEECGFTDRASTVYRCTLRPGLQFTNGNDLTSKDVKYSFDRVLRIRHRNGPAVLLNSIKNITTPDGRTVVFHLGKPDAAFPMKIASGAGAIVDHREYPKDRLRGGPTMVGSGVYELARFTPDVSARFLPNADYRGPAKTKNAGLTLRFFTGDRTGLAKAVRTGTVDVAYRGLSAADIGKLTNAGVDNTTVVEGTSAEVQHLVFNADDRVTGKKAVRQAVAQIVDRKAIARKAFGHTTEALYSIIPKGITGHNTAFYDRYGDPSVSKAARILRKAGITREVPLTLWYTPVRYGPGTEAAVLELRDQLNASGLFDADAKNVPWDRYKKQYTAGRYGAYVVGWIPDFPDPDNFVSPFFGRGNVLSNHYTNPRITDDLIPGTGREARRDNTVAAYSEIQDTVAEDVPMLPLWQGKQYAVAQRDVTGLEWTLDASTVFRFWEINKSSL